MAMGKLQEELYPFYLRVQAYDMKSGTPSICSLDAGVNFPSLLYQMATGQPAKVSPHAYHRMIVEYRNLYQKALNLKRDLVDGLA